MARLRRQDSFEEVQKAGHFRSVTPLQVLAGAGKIFNPNLPSLLEAAGSPHIRFPTREQLRQVGNKLFNESSETGEVNFFISHSWKAGRYTKFLALCLYFNLEMAVACCFAAWLLVAGSLLGGGGVTVLGGSYLALPCLVYLPMGIFFLVFFFGQHLSVGRCSPSLWLDRLCVHQTDLELKSQQIAALPLFVAHSRRMLIIWDESWSSRLWCNLELAAFARHGGAENVVFLPAWLAPWLVNTILLDLLSATLFELSEHVFPAWSAAWAAQIITYVEPLLGDNEILLTFVANFLLAMIAGGVSYLPGAIPALFSFRMKLRNHEVLLQQMAEFDVTAAACTDPADRDAVEHHVRELFRDSNSPLAADTQRGTLDDAEALPGQDLHGDPLDRFNAYVRATLRESMMAQIGDELYLPWRLCLTASLPMTLYSTVSVLGCDNEPCAESAQMQGYRSTAQYMFTQGCFWLLTLLISYPVVFPILLRMLKRVLTYGDGPVQLLLGILCCCLAYGHCTMCISWVVASLTCFMQSYSPTLLLIFLLVLVVQVVQVTWLFSPNARGTQKQPSGRSVLRQVQYDVVQEGGSSGLESSSSSGLESCGLLDCS